MTFKSLRTPPKSNKQVQEYVQAVEKGLDSYFVVKVSNKGWYVQKASTHTTNGKHFPTKAAAIETANRRAAKRNSKVYVFDK
jgi:hypothetical protein